MQDIVDGVKGWFNKNGADSNPFMLPKESIFSPTTNAGVGMGVESLKFFGPKVAPYIFGSGAIMGAGLTGAILGGIIPLVDASNAANSEKHIGKTAQIITPEGK